jgi:hypothetical protein
VLASPIRKDLPQYSHPPAQGVPDQQYDFNKSIQFIIRCAIIFVVIWIIQVIIAVKQIFIARNSFRCAIVIAFYWIPVDSPDWVDIYDLSSSSKEVLFRQSWLQR